MSDETPWGRDTWHQPRKRIGRIEPLPIDPAHRLRWLPLWLALAAFAFFAILLGLGRM